MERSSALSTPARVLEAKRMETSVDVEAVACVVASGVNTTQLDNQGHPQGSSSVSPPPSSFNMLPTEHVQALHRNLAAELIHTGTGKSPILPSKFRYPQDPGTAVSINAPIVARRNNLNSSLQDGHLIASSVVEELREEGQDMANRIQSMRQESQANAQQLRHIQQERLIQLETASSPALRQGDIQQGNQDMAQQVESVHQENPYLQERAALENRRKANLALAAAKEARTVEQA
jgi:hypothetical protein